jgi:hypothetical protein
MARRVSIPSIDGLLKTPNRKAAALLDNMMSEAEASTRDDEFEVIDTGGPALLPTTSSNPTRPRTLKAGYDYETQVLVVVFRDGTWWEYRNVPVSIWDGFKMADSKGRYLKESGLDTWDSMGPANVDNMPKHRREALNDLQEFTEYMYGAKTRKV